MATPFTSCVVVPAEVVRSEARPTGDPQSADPVRDPARRKTTEQWNERARETMPSKPSLQVAEDGVAVALDVLVPSQAVPDLDQ
jgi:hypothetical protein